jgi:hypothetical protein
MMNIPDKLYNNLKHKAKVQACGCESHKATLSPVVQKSPPLRVVFLLTALAPIAPFLCKKQYVYYFIYRSNLQLVVARGHTFKRQSFWLKSKL